MSRHPNLLLALTLLAAPATIAAQGSLATQGLGFATGQLSAASRATSGALGEFDPQSPINPAALSGWGRGAIYFQFEPERRTTTVGGVTDRTTTSRFPVFSAGLGIGERFTLGLSASTLLDRTWQVTDSGSAAVGGGEVGYTETNESIGAINDLRLGAGYAVRRWLRVGLGVHALSGENRLRLLRVFTDSTFVGFEQSRRLTYTGTAVSAGVTIEPTRWLVLGASGRLGRPMRARDAADTVIATADFPDRFGVGISARLATRTVLVGRADWTGWTSLAPLSTGAAAPCTVTATTTCSARPRDVWSTALGLETGGPRLFRTPTLARLGIGQRGLPYGVGTDEPSEFSTSAGLGLVLSQGRAGVDLGLQHLRRSTDLPNVQESSTIFTIGVVVRP